MKKIKIMYYALLREERGVGVEELETSAQTAQELYQELQEKHGFRLDYTRVKVAINDIYAKWEDSIKEGDTIIFVPPVSGG